MISTTARYALQATVYLAEETRQFKFVNRASIARATLVPIDYLLKVLNELDSAGIVESRRGPGGGYRLVKQASQVTALEVVLAVDKIPRIKTCPLGISKHKTLCPLHKLLDHAAEAVEKAFASVTIEQLATKGNRKTCPFPHHEIIAGR